MNDIIYTVYKNKVIENSDKSAIFDTNRKLTRKELDKLADTIATQIPQGAKKAGIIMDHSVEMIAAIFAVLKTGAAYVPVEPFFPKERIKFIMQEAQTDCIITNSKYCDIVKDIRNIVVDKNYPINFESPDMFEPAKNNVSANSLAYILYTSGTTGKPKGIAVENKNVCNYVKAFQKEFNPTQTDIMLQYSVCSFDIFVEEVFATLLSGATLAIAPDNTRNNISELMDFINKNKITILSGFPYLYQEMNNLKEIPKSLRLLISGGDVLRGDYISNLKDKITIYNTYGPSETTVVATYYNCSKGYVLSDGTYPIGKPILNYDIVICDDNGNILPHGKRGEICILGKGVAQGYIGKRFEENKAFKILPDGKRIYHSGDLGYFLPDGNIAFLHRKDNQVMILGKRVEPDEVKTVMMNYPKIKQAIVLASTDKNNLSYLTAYYVKEDKETKLEEIKSYMKQYLTEYMIPEFFVELEKLPLNSHGKIDKQALPAVIK